MPVKTAKTLLSTCDPEYIQFGLIMVGSDAALKAQCAERGAILSFQ